MTKTCLARASAPSPSLGRPGQGLFTQRCDRGWPEKLAVVTSCGKARPPIRAPAGRSPANCKQASDAPAQFDSSVPYWPLISRTHVTHAGYLDLEADRSDSSLGSRRVAACTARETGRVSVRRASTHMSENTWSAQHGNCQGSARAPRSAGAHAQAGRFCSGPE